MQQGIQPLQEKLEKDGNKPYSTKTAMQEITNRVSLIKRNDLALDLLPLFENHIFIKTWLDSFQDMFYEYIKKYI